MIARLRFGLTMLLTAAASAAVMPPQGDDPLRERSFRHPDLDYRSVYVSLAELSPVHSRGLELELVELGVEPANAYFDLRTGRWGTLILSRPLVPGPGVANDLSWSVLGRDVPHDTQGLLAAVGRSFRDFLDQHAHALRIDLAQLAEPRLASHGERVIQIHVGRQVGGIPVRGAFVKATVNSGNLILLGQRAWGNLAVDMSPAVPADAAEEALGAHLDGTPVAGYRRPPRLEIVPTSDLEETMIEVPGEGLSHRLVWALSPRFERSAGTWEALVDAHSGELLAFTDTNRYATRGVVGGIYPLSNDGNPPDGVEQPGYPMPFADLTLDGVPIGYTDTGGNVASCRQGTLRTHLQGRYVRMRDECGRIDESADVGDIDLGSGPGGICAEPEGDHSWGDTHATRTGFYELNRLAEQARGYLPGNIWLNRPLVANVNLSEPWFFCNAFWDGVKVSFASFGAKCTNVGEIATVHDHEWGHGMDDNDTDATVSTPAEGIADIFAQNRQNDSCLGRGWSWYYDQCHGYGDPCLDCPGGVREADWAKRESGEPHDIEWILSPFYDPGGGCYDLTDNEDAGPCGEQSHCEGTTVSEAVWDLVHRDLMGYEGSELDLDVHTALELGTRLTYYGSSNVGNWFQCVTDGTGGCNADGGYLNYLAVDDDNGDLTDGTPHMSAIFAAFDRHQLACPTPTVQNSGCAAGPSQAPANVVATPLDKGVHLTWDPVPGAGEYWIFRTEGVRGCASGKSKVGETTRTEFTESGLRNGLEAYYGVVAVGANDACTSPMSACRAVTPTASPGLRFDPSPLAWRELLGDGDPFLDNCEAGWLRFRVDSTGTGALTRPRIVAARVPSHPEVEVLTSLPAPLASSLSECGSATGELLVRGAGLGSADTLEIELGVTSDELHPAVVTQVYGLHDLESDFDFRASKKFKFETPGGEGWILAEGLFGRTDVGGGADGSQYYVRSSAYADLQCDRAQSPLLRLTPSSTLKLFSRFEIEEESNAWYDRASVGLSYPHLELRDLVIPDGGRRYNADGEFGSCVTQGQPGWAGTRAAWQASTWSSDALGGRARPNEPVRLEVAYGTDEYVALQGFQFDEVTVSSAFVQSPDASSDACSAVAFAASGLAVDPGGNGVLEVGESAPVEPAWTNVGSVARSLAGSAEGFDGPGTSDYRIQDGAAQYAQAAPGVESDCRQTGDCYRVSVSSPSSRPSRHWDATFDEHVSAPADRSWTLHLGGSFADVSKSHLFYRQIETLLHNGVTSGCDASRYCLGGRTTRAQMAAFVLRAMERTGYAPPPCEAGGEVFSDVPAASPFCPWIEDLAERGIVGGCGGDAYCPDGLVTRAQMAVFALRTLEGGSYAPPPCEGGSRTFQDVPSTSLFCTWIEELARRAVVSGCGNGNYCPGQPVTRGQMAVFITKTFGLALYGP